jgi:hypothetical protein
VSVFTQAGYIVYQNIFSWLLLWRGGVMMVQGLPVYSLADYHVATLILPAGLCVALLVVSGLKETYCRHVQT